MAELTLRRAREDDAERVAELLYESAAAMYDRFTGGTEQALELLRRGFVRPGTSASAEVVTVAEGAGEVVGVLAAFPVEESSARAGAFLRLTLRGLPPWRWPGALRVYWVGGRAVPSPPASSLYVDALAVLRGARRRGTARALLRHAEELARALGVPSLALDTTLDNRPARSLYVAEGFEEVAYRPPRRGLPGFVALVKPLV